MSTKIIYPIKEESWEELFPEFEPKEFGKYYNKIDIRLMSILYKLRKVINLQFIIHEAYAESGHVENSLHYVGWAVDFHIKEVALDIAYEKISTYTSGLYGLGTYPYWNNPGFHLDIGHPKEWWRDKYGKYRALGNINKQINLESYIEFQRALREVSGRN